MRFYFYFLDFVSVAPWRKVKVLHLNKNESSSLRDALCQLSWPYVTICLVVLKKKFKKMYQ